VISKVSGGGSFTATANKVVLTDNGVSVTCSTQGKTAASTSTGAIPNGTQKDALPLTVGMIKKLSFSHCTGPLGMVTTKVESLPYSLDVDSATSSMGQTDVIISGIKTSVSMPDCSFTVSGSAPGYYTSGTHTLTLTATLPVSPLNNAELTVSGVSGCAIC
jgi:hypothetical protein